MKGTFCLYKQIPEQKEIGIGCLTVMEMTNQAIFLEGDGNNNKVMAEMARARLEYASATGIMLSGFEPINSKQLRYQEWFLLYQ